MRILTLLIITGLATGCISNKECRRRSKTDMQVMLNSLQPRVESNTVIEYKDTTIYTALLHVDTVLITSHDTVVLHKDKLTVKYIKVKDTVKLAGECASDTIKVYKVLYKETKVLDHITNSLPPEPSSYFNSWWWWLVAGATGYILGRVKWQR